MKKISELRDCAAPVARIFKIAQRKTARRRKPEKPILSARALMKAEATEARPA
jgi:hypothetical protein